MGVQIRHGVLYPTDKKVVSYFLSFLKMIRLKCLLDDGTERQMSDGNTESRLKSA